MGSLSREDGSPELSHAATFLTKGNSGRDLP
jgi:hypothetical protein